MPTTTKLSKKPPASAKKLSCNIIEKLKGPLDSRLLEVKDSEICGQAFFVTRTGTKPWCFPQKVLKSRFGRISVNGLLSPLKRPAKSDGMVAKK